MLSCKEVSGLIASEGLAEAGWRHRLAARLHLLMCRHCRRYARQMRQIGEAAKEVFSDQPVEPEARDRLRSTILDQIPSSDQNDPDSPL